MTFRRTAFAVVLLLVSGVAGVGVRPSPAGAADPPVTLSPTSGPAGTSITVTLPSACTLPPGPAVSGGVYLQLEPEGGGDGGTFQSYPENPGDSVTQVTLAMPVSAPRGHYTVSGGCSVIVPPGATFVSYGPVFFEVTGGTPLPSLTVVPVSGPTGTAIDVSGACAPAPGETVAVFTAVLFSSTDPNLAVVNSADGSGPIMHTTLTVPSEFPPGSYLIGASCYDYVSYTNFAESPFTVEGDAAPAALLTVTPSATVPLGVSADASASTDTDATPIATYTFDWGDGSALTGPQAAATALHTYAGVGTFPVKVTVTDTAGLTGTATQLVKVSVQGLPCGALLSCSTGTSTSPSGTASATSPGKGGAITASATGVGGITVGRYPTNPVGPPTFNATGAFFDVAISKPNSFTTVSIDDCDLRGGTTVQWWNPTANAGAGAWQSVSNQSFSKGPPACVHITIDATTSPSLTDLSGTVFGIAAPSSVAIGNGKVFEGDAGTRIVRFPVTLSPASTSPVTVDYTTVNGTGRAPGDYTTKTGTLTFPAGSTSQQVSVTVSGNTINEGTEYFKVKLSNPQGAALHDDSGTGVILGDDPGAAAAHLTIGSASVYEGEGGSSVQVIVSLSKASASPVSVHFATANGTAAAPGDYTASSGNLTFAPGETSKAVTIAISGDIAPESTETFTIDLSAASGAAISNATGTVKILNGI